jgi:hypothetical protein
MSKTKARGQECLAEIEVEVEIEIEIIYNMYRVKPVSVYGPSRLRHLENLQAGSRL